MRAWESLLISRNHKTFRSKGVDETEYQQDRFPEFCDSLRRYIDDGYRKTLVSSHKHHFVFVDAGGDGFDDRSFSRYLGTLLQRLSGQRMTSNLLRSSFISDLSSSTSNPDVRESAAILMRHSVNEAMRTYDRRDPASRKEAAQAILSTKKRELDREDSDRPVKIVDSLFSRGDVVAVPYRDDDSGDANFWLAYIIKSSAAEVGLMELVCINESDQIYQPKLGSVWSEPASTCFHVQFDCSATTGHYRLISPPQEIRGLLNKGK